MEIITGVESGAGSPGNRKCIEYMKSIQVQWTEFQKCCVDPAAQSEQIRQLRMVFFAGFAASMVTFQNTPDDISGPDLERLVWGYLNEAGQAMGAEGRPWIESQA